MHGAARGGRATPHLDGVFPLLHVHWHGLYSPPFSHLGCGIKAFLALALSVGQPVHLLGGLARHISLSTVHQWCNPWTLRGKWTLQGWPRRCRWRCHVESTWHLRQHLLGQPCLYVQEPPPLVLHLDVAVAGVAGLQMKLHLLAGVDLHNVAG